MSNRTSAVAQLVAGSAVRPVIPADFDQAVRIAKTAVQAGLFQAESEEKALAQATMAVLQGLELGIAPMQAVQQIAIIGGRCTIWGDLIPALIWRAGHTIREWIEGEGEARVAWCEITRGDNKEVIRRKFSVNDAKRAGLWDPRPKLKRKDNTNSWSEEDNDSPWYRYDERMLQMRARGFCARDGVPDALHGLYIREEREEELHPSEAQDKAPVRKAEDLFPPPAPEEDPETPVAPAKAAGPLAPLLQAETVGDPDDFLSDLDVSLAVCKTADQLDEVWAENLETVCALGMQPRQKAELIYDRHQSRRRSIPGQQHESLSGRRPRRRAQFSDPQDEGKEALGRSKARTRSAGIFGKDPQAALLHPILQGASAIARSSSEMHRRKRYRQEVIQQMGDIALL